MPRKLFSEFTDIPAVVNRRLSNRLRTAVAHARFRECGSQDTRASLHLIPKTQRAYYEACPI